jgi:hypothetical protein
MGWPQTVLRCTQRSVQGVAESSLRLLSVWQSTSSASARKGPWCLQRPEQEHSVYFLGLHTPMRRQGTEYASSNVTCRETTVYYLFLELIGR